MNSPLGRGLVDGLEGIHQAVDLDGTTGRITSSYLPWVNGGIQTFEGWAYRDVNTAYHHLFGDVGTSQHALRIDTGSNDVRFLPTAGAETIWAGAWPGTAQWTHWALITDATADTAELFINGASISVKSFVWSWPAGGGFEAGARLNAVLPWNGKFSRIAIYPAALSAARIAAHYAARTNGYNASVLADSPSLFWKLDETSGTVAADSSAGGTNTGTYTGTYTLNVAGPVP